MVLVFWQSSKFWNKDDGMGGGGRGGGFAGRRALDGRGGLEDFDMDKFRKLQQMGGGGAPGSDFAEAYRSTFGRARNDRDFSRDPDVLGSRLEEIDGK